MEALIAGLCSWDRHHLSHSQAVLICLCVTCPAENLSYLGCLAPLVRKCQQGTPSELLTSLHICSCLSTHQDIWSALWQSSPTILRWLLVVLMRLHPLPLLITLPTADTHHESLLVFSPILAHGSELPPCMIHSKASCSHAFMLPLQPLCLEPYLLAQFFPGLGRGQLCVYLQIPNCNSLSWWMLNPPLTVSWWWGRWNRKAL